MVESITRQQQLKNTVYQPDELFSALIVQKLYDRVWHKSNGKIKQFYIDLDDVISDQNEAIRATGFLKANNFGENNELILNSDLDNNSISEKDALGFIKGLAKRFKINVDIRFLGFMFFASHGMAFESTQHIVLNEYDQKKKFYKLFAAENSIRYLSNKYMNCYYISIFACCREIWMAKKHADCVGANSLLEAKEKIDQVNEEQQMKEEQKLTLEQYVEELKKENQRLRQKLSHFDAEENEQDEEFA